MKVYRLVWPYGNGQALGTGKNIYKQQLWYCYCGHIELARPLEWALQEQCTGCKRYDGVQFYIEGIANQRKTLHTHVNLTGYQPKR